MRIIVPVKPLAQAKSRLGSVLSADERAEVMRGLLDRVIAAAREVAPVSVVTADPAVAARSRAAGAEVIDEGEVMGLDGAVRLGVDCARQSGEKTAMILPADLPDVTADALRAMIAQARPGAVRLGVDRARHSGENTTMILPADLPDVTADALRAMMAQARPGAVVIAPSRDGGTNALILASRLDFRFAYGPDSFSRHSREGLRLGLEVVVHESLALRVDIDWPEDLADHRDLWAA